MRTVLSGESSFEHPIAAVTGGMMFRWFPHRAEAGPFEYARDM